MFISSPELNYNDDTLTSIAQDSVYALEQIQNKGCYTQSIPEMLTQLKRIFHNT